MIEVLAKLAEIALKPLVESGAKLFSNLREPRRRLAKALLDLYESMEKLEADSERAVSAIRRYVADDRTAWTIVRNRRHAIFESIEAVRQSASSYGERLHHVYSLLEIKYPSVLEHLTGIYAVKSGMLRGNIPLLPPLHPDQIDIHKYDRERNPIAIMPRSELLNVVPSEELLRSYAQDRAAIENKYFHPVDFDDPASLASFLTSAEQALEDMADGRAQLRNVISANMTVEDFFR